MSYPDPRYLGVGRRGVHRAPALPLGPGGDPVGTRAALPPVEGAPRLYFASTGEWPAQEELLAFFVEHDNHYL